MYQNCIGNHEGHATGNILCKQYDWRDCHFYWIGSTNRQVAEEKPSWILNVNILTNKSVLLMFYH